MHVAPFKHLISAVAHLTPDETLKEAFSGKDATLDLLTLSIDEHEKVSQSHIKSLMHDLIANVP